MNKASGKLAAGVRKVKTEQKASAVVTRAATPPAASRRVAAATRAAAPRVAAVALHPDRIWPD